MKELCHFCKKRRSNLFKLSALLDGLSYFYRKNQKRPQKNLFMPSFDRFISHLQMREALVRNALRVDINSAEVLEQTADTLLAVSV